MPNTNVQTVYLVIRNKEHNVLKAVPKNGSIIKDIVHVVKKTVMFVNLKQTVENVSTEMFFIKEIVFHLVQKNTLIEVVSVLKDHQKQQYTITPHCNGSKTKVSKSIIKEQEIQ